ncbi:hypothetical protein DIURU_001216 [Diutina rugosa]|uniref:Protein PAR32 n=1 Tax=Diutina rugosa TaxID=5481 RepID=A0A642UUX7_DIURU|nr:uncharacterized protein DIURU_001216 [Diutina rugosa]KAA8906034.1 hypothetical protein DIURU_001216 [Diutina rugosa]
MSRGGAGNIEHQMHQHQQSRRGSVLSAFGDNHSIHSSQDSFGVKPVRSNPLRPVASNRSASMRPVMSNRSGSGLTTSLSNHEHYLHPTTSHNKKTYYSTGRGGAGNIASVEGAPPSPKIVAQGENYPTLHTAKVSTGRGGYGNMVENSNPDFTRRLQDVDGKPELNVVPSNKSISVGRGGFGNITTTKSAASQSSNPMQQTVSPEVNLYTISSQGNELKKKRNKSFLGKIKEIFGS